MTSPIKPSGSVASALLEGVTDASRVEGAASVDAATTSAVSAPDGVVVDLVSKLESGALSREAFVDEFVRAQLARPEAAGWSEAVKAKVGEALRDTLLGDPAFGSLLSDVEPTR